MMISRILFCALCLMQCNCVIKYQENDFPDSPKEKKIFLEIEDKIYSGKTLEKARVKLVNRNVEAICVEKDVLIFEHSVLLGVQLRTLSGKQVKFGRIGFLDVQFTEDVLIEFNEEISFLTSIVGRFDIKKNQQRRLKDFRVNLPVHFCGNNEEFIVRTSWTPINR